jgi:hypothetical protein
MLQTYTEFVLNVYFRVSGAVAEIIIPNSIRYNTVFRRIF